MRFIDVHCHLNNKDYGDLDGLLLRFKEFGVEKVISAGFDYESSVESMRLAEKYEGVYFTAGYHPTELKKYKEGELEKIERMLSHPKCVALGEIGLDYHYPDTDRENQYKFFLAQIDIAYRNKMPIVIHSRDCAADMLELLQNNAEKLCNGALLHCYSHSVEMAKIFEKLGIKFSFGGTSTYSGSKKAKRVIKALKGENLLTETDSPYLPPKSIYGQFPNTPLSIPEICGNMASLRETSIEEMSETVWQNAHTLFKKL